MQKKTIKKKNYIVYVLAVSVVLAGLIALGAVAYNHVYAAGFNAGALLGAEWTKRYVNCAGNTPPTLAVVRGAHEVNDPQQTDCDLVKAIVQ